MEKFQLKATTRKDAARGNNKLRESGVIPAVLYGNKLANVNLAINQIEFEKLFRKAGESTIVELAMEDGKVHNVLVQDIQKHYLTSSPIHVDFYEVSMTEKLTATVAIEFINEAPAVKALGGTLVKVLNEVEVQCLPVDLPHNIEVDISVLKTFEDTLSIKDLKISDKVEILGDADDLVVKVQPPRDIEAELAEPVVEDISKVEGAAEDKPEEAVAEEEKK
jgi:large subunit ribosomal protein L25